MKKILPVLLISVIAIGIGIFIVSNKDDSKKNNTANEKKERVTIAMVTFPGYAPLYLADEKNFFGENVDVELVRIESIGDMRSAMKTGDIDIYAATYDIFQATEDTVPPGIAFLALDESNGGDGVVVTKNIQSLADLRGKTVGGEPGFPPYFILQYLLNKEGMTLDDVRFQDVTSQDAGNAFVAGQLDVAATYEPYLSTSADKVEGSRILISSANTPNLIVDFLFASEDLVTKNPEALQSIAKGWFAATEYIQTNPEESYEIMADAFGVSVEEMKDFKTGIEWLTLAQNKELFDRRNSSNAYDTFTLVGDILEANGGTTLRVQAEDALTDAVLKKF